MTLRVVGSDDQRRNALAALLVERLAAIDGVRDIDRNDKRGKAQIRIDLDYVRLADAGLSVADFFADYSARRVPVVLTLPPGAGPA